MEQQQTDAGEPCGQSRSNAGLGLVERLRNWPQHYPGGFGLGAAIHEAADEIERLRADLKAMEGFADLWYFVSDEAPLEFEKIVAEHSPGRWLGEAAKLRAAKREA